MTSSYLVVMAGRFSFMVGVISSPPGSQNAGTMANRLTCSTRDNLPLAFSTAAPIASRTAG